MSTDKTKTKSSSADIQQELATALEEVSRAYGMIKGFSQEYHTIWVVDKDTLQMHLIRSSGVNTIQGAVQLGKDYPNFDVGFEKYIETYVEPEDRKRMHKEIASGKVLEELDKSGFYSVNYLRRDEAGNVGYHQIAFSNADTEDGKRQFVYGFRDIDKIIKEDRKQKNALHKAKQLAEKRSKELSEQLGIINSLSKVYNVIYYVNLKDFSFIQMGVNLDGVEEIIGTKGNAIEAFERMYKFLVAPGQVETIRKFTDLTTINKRLKKRDWIAQQFYGPVGGWSEGIFIAAGRDLEGNCDHVIWATRSIDELKREEERLVRQSQTDELTGLFNRRAYEDCVSEFVCKKPSKNLVYVSMDVNGLKNVNDTIGHAAGDELLVGASDCMRQCFGPYGKLYRTGGDEFAAFIYAGEEQLAEIKSDFADATAQWQGTLVDSLSVACGYVMGRDLNGKSMHEIAVLADQRMYEEKTRYYNSKGVDRRGQRDAHIALCALYIKILKLNLTKDSCQVVDFIHEDRDGEPPEREKASDWLGDFVKAGMVHPQDVKNFKEKMDGDYLKNYFREGNKSLSIYYRRKQQEHFRAAFLEMIPANDYTDEEQTVFVYVRYIDN